MHYFFWVYPNCNGGVEMECIKSRPFSFKFGGFPVKIGQWDEGVTEVCSDFTLNSSFQVMPTGVHICAQACRFVGGISRVARTADFMPHGPMSRLGLSRWE
ncbi:unnamed protein product [Protopolystoma xenopodis]|uniref:Uncharacterized protein n=1 Tax=Protopolystoma xenopodis TaxID=117903 RepID=A0A448XD42_9PLAT|nr:unnamed protein product [Protopolystoma xenopodis]